MARQGKIEQSGLNKEVYQLALKGYSVPWIGKWIRDRGLEIDDQSVRRFLIRCGIDKKEVDAKSASQLNATIELEPIDLSELEKLNKAAKCLEFADLADMAQREVAQIYLKMCLIVNQKLDRYAKGEDKYPHEQIKGLAALTNVLDSIWSYRPGVNLARAYEVLEGEGYRILPPERMEALPESKPDD